VDEDGQPINNGKGEVIEGSPFLDAMDFHEWDYSWSREKGVRRDADPSPRRPHRSRGKMSWR